MAKSYSDADYVKRGGREGGVGVRRQTKICEKKQVDEYVLIPMFPYKPAAMRAVITARTFPTVCQAKMLMPWNASASVNWPWKEYTNNPNIM